ncbi:TniQ family protein [Rhizobium giardinii]|uniref:TniQ domain-containing protein n=1 Tax=Rhizobium giardinii TaxID=56731 RepID=A0A7W8X7M3_9HYPH|nr:TniQ family protein [Rhizobium giardinii]MBB5536420.1 hypothetical protein [Rhizobium giardinii]
MTAIDAHAPTISIRERYRDVVSERWPVIVTPQHDELLSSWLHRLAYANGLAPRQFARVLGLHAGMWSASLDLKLPADVENLLRAHTGISPQRLSAMMLARSSLKPLLLPLRSSGRRDSSTWLQFCSRCLAEDAHPYFRRRWRLAQASCATHRGGLRDRCPSCHSRIAVFDQSELVPQHYCVYCGFDLRRASKVPMSLPATRLDRCINDICRLEAITGSLRSGMLVQRLLRMPSVSGSFPTASLSSLSVHIDAHPMCRTARGPTNRLVNGRRRCRSRTLAAFHPLGGWPRPLDRAACECT